ncbi:MAG: helix-turn-helix domain-containing protein [Thermomicrobia bacterium]|nr:helix-turn-helix domain-containing protein [Thermomicrobia bacterium]
MTNSAVSIVRDPASEPPVLLRDHEVAAILNISRSKAYLLMASGDIPGVLRLGRSIRVHRPTLLAWLTQQAA